MEAQRERHLAASSPEVRREDQHGRADASEAACLPPSSERDESRAQCESRKSGVFFSLSSWALALIIFAVVFGVTLAGVATGRYLRKHSAKLKEPFGVLQGALLGVVGLLLAFGLTLAVGRYQDRRAAVVAEANAIGTTYLRAQTLAEPVRANPSDCFAATPISRSVCRPRCRGAARQSARPRAEDTLQRKLWSLAGQSLLAAPVASAPRLYVDTLNTMIDQQTVRISALNNRVPGAVLALEVFGAAVALALLGMYLAVLGRGHVTDGGRRGARHDAPARDLRSRPSHAGPDHRPGHAAHIPARIDGSAPGRPGALAADYREEAALAAPSSCRATAGKRPSDLLDRDLEASDDAGVAASRE